MEINEVGTGETWMIPRAAARPAAGRCEATRGPLRSAGRAVRPAWLVALVLAGLLPGSGAASGGRQFPATIPELFDRPLCPDIGSRREIFVDYYLVDRMQGTRLRLHPPAPAEVVVRRDRGWEGDYGFGQDVLLLDGKYRMYYRGSNRLCYAESADGVHWTKPDLGVVEFAGSRRNNLVGTEAGGTLYDAATEPSARIFLDTRPGIPSGERLKALSLNEGKKANPTPEELAEKDTVDPQGLWRSGPRDVVAWVSADGVRWRKLREKPILRTNVYGSLDGDFSFFWSATENRYVMYTRYYTSRDSSGRRSIARTASPDLFDWSPLVPMTFEGTGIIPAEHLYINLTLPYFRAPHVYVAMPARLMEGRQVLTDAQARALGVQEGYWNDCAETVLMTTRGGQRYDRTFMEGFIRPGIGPLNWVTRTNYALRGVVPTGDTEMSVYVTRQAGTTSWHIQRCVLRLDGFASVNAPAGGGEMVTRLFTFAGKELVLNYSTAAAGGLRVEIQGPAGEPIPGYALGDCREIVGDEIERVVTWRQGANVQPLAGKPVRLRFVMADADLYSLRFR
jgi:hypothetical protein